jgi:antitoxin HicB
MTQKTNPNDNDPDFDPQHVGSSFSDWLKEEGIADAVYEAATKELFVEELLKTMRDKKVTKTAMAAALGTSRNQLARILDPGCEAITLGALKRAAAVVGKSIRLELVDD